MVATGLQLPCLLHSRLHMRAMLTALVEQPYTVVPSC
jgi:hypothetical protein